MCAHVAFGIFRSAKAASRHFAKIFKKQDKEIKKKELEWSAEKDALLINLHAQLGNRWAQITRSIFGAVLPDRNFRGLVNLSIRTARTTCTDFELSTETPIFSFPGAKIA